MQRLLKLRLTAGGAGHGEDRAAVPARRAAAGSLRGHRAFCTAGRELEGCSEERRYHERQNYPPGYKLLCYANG